MSDKEKERFDRSESVLEKASIVRGGRILRRLDGKLPPVALALLRARHFVKQRKSADAQANLKTVLDANPDFAPALALRGPLLFQDGQREQGLSDVRAALTAAPRVTDLYATLAMLLLRVGDWDEARQTLERAYKEVGRTDPLAATYRLIVKAQNGPNFGVTHQHKTRNYHIISDIDRKTCFEAGRILEDAYRAYNVHLKWAKNHGKVRRFRVFLFSGEAGYHDFTKDVIGVSPKGSAGLFSPILKQLLIWNLPDRDAMMRTVRHEGFHQYLDRVMHDPPSWLNEGLAEYYETAGYRRGQWRTGGVRDDHLDMLRRGFGKLRPFLLGDNRKFYRNPRRNYAYAWAVVYTLRHGTSEHRRFFKTLFKDLQAPRPSRAVLLAALKTIDVDHLETAVREFVRTGSIKRTTR